MFCQSQCAKSSAAIKRRNQRFLEMAPAIRRYADTAFRQVKAEARAELVAEVIANAFVAFARLARCGRDDIAYPTPLARYAVRRICDGRRVGTRSNRYELLSSYGKQRTGVKIKRLDTYDANRGEWREAVVEDRRAGPAETAAARIDLDAWLRSLPQRRRIAAVLLARGETTGAVARNFRVSAARVSQLRNELHEAWLRFHGESQASCQVTAAA
jgi:hypothetical protein